jgi:aminocarboxymuconate-semialdehyde decarboxylase
MRAIDVHTHVTPRRFRDAVADGGEWHGLTATTGELEIPKFSLRAADRVAEMDEMGVAVQVLSPNTGFYCYDRTPEAAGAIARECLDELAEMRDEFPDRFEIAGTVPMQDVAVAVAELEFAMLERGACGVMIDDQVSGHTYDEQQFHPFWKAAEELGALVLFHQGGPTLVDERTSRYALSNSIGNLVERALSFGTLVFGGVIDEFPNLRLCLCHAGGYVAFGIARMDKAWRAGKEGIPGFEDAALNLDRPPSDYLSSFYYDCCTHSPETLRFLIDTVGIDRVVFGTDYPAKMILDDGVEWINGLDVLGSEEKAALLYENATPLLEPATSGTAQRSREGTATSSPLTHGEPEPEPSAP